MTITGLQVERLILRSFTKIFNSMHVLNQITTLKKYSSIGKESNQQRVLFMFKKVDLY